MRESIWNWQTSGGSGHTLRGMTVTPSPMWRRMLPYLRTVALAVLPVPDLVTRIRIRRTARRLIACHPWPGMTATGPDAAQLALHRVLWLQRQTRRAVRSRQPEAAVMLARVTIETTITGLYCLHQPGAVAQLQGENLRTLPLLLQFLTDADLIPASVLAECIARLNLGTPAKGPALEVMARHVDMSTGGSVATGLYNKYYRPASTLTMHGGAAALLLHVTADDKLTRRPSRTWARRSPARIADSCLGALTAAVAQRAGADYTRAVKYADKHGDRALTPVAVISSAGFRPMLAPRRLVSSLRQLRETGDYVWSGRDVGGPAARTARVRSGMEALLTAGLPSVPAGALDPFLDFITDKIVTESAAGQAAPAASAGPAPPGP